MMETQDIHTDKTLLADIEAMRSQFPQTQDLYREVCTLMFFRYGITPTANKLYQLVRKGSMSAPAEALNRFWENLREKSRVTIIHADLPDELRLAAGELTATLWRSAQAGARADLAAFKTDAAQQVEQVHAELAGFKLDAERRVDAANAAAAQAARDGDEMARALEQAQVAFELAQQQIGSLREELAAGAATIVSLQERLAESRQENALQQGRLDAAAREHAGQLELLHAATQLAQDRYRALEERALLEVDRERTLAGKLQKAFEAERAAAAASQERHRIELNGLQVSFGDLRQQNGALEGTLLAVTSARDHAHEQLQEIRQQLDAAQTRSTAAELKVEQVREQLQEVRATQEERIEAARVTERNGAANGKKARRNPP